MLIELSKVNAPSLLLSEFNYYFNKAINNYINQRYFVYDTSQQTTDDIRVLKATAILTPTKAYSDDKTATSYLSAAHSSLANLQGATYEVNLPMDYLHLLNCVCVFKVNKTWKCYDQGSIVAFPANKLTADAWSKVMNDYYNRPRPEHPYYYIHNVNPNTDLPTNPVNWDDEGNYVSGTDMLGTYQVTKNANDDTEAEAGYTTESNPGSNFSRVLDIKGTGVVSTVEKATAHRYGNASNVRMEIRYGRDASVFELIEVQVDYIKTPQYIRLTQEQMDFMEDTSQIMEYPDYVCQEIINELTKLVMVRTGDPITSNFISVNNTIPSAAQVQQAQASQQAQ